MKCRLERVRYVKSVLLVVAVLLLVPLVLGAGFKQEAVAATPKAKEPVKICVITVLTGPFSGTGRAQLIGAELAADMINAEGGIQGRPVKILARDTEIRAATATRVAREVHTREGVKLFAGVVSSAVALGLGPVMEELDSVLVVSAAASTKITGTKFNKHVFRCSPSTREHRFAFVDLIHSKFPHLKRWAHIDPDYEYGHSAWDNTIYKLYELDPEIKVVSHRWVPFGAAGGFAPHITAIMGTKPQVLCTNLYGGDLLAFLKEAKEFGLFEQIDLLFSGHMDWDVTVTLGAKFPTTIWTGEHYAEFCFNSPLSEKYERTFKEKYGEDYFALFQGHAAPTFNSIYLYKQAIESVGSLKTKDVIKGIEKIGWWETNHGKEFMNGEDHQNYIDHAWFQIIPDKTQPRGFRIGEHGVLHCHDYMLPAEKTLIWDNLLAKWRKAHPELIGR